MEEQLQLFQNEVLGKMFGSKKDEVSEQFWILHYEEVCDL
jgi:hypothetical protein